MTQSHTPQDLPQDVFTLEGGGCLTVALPETLSRREYEDLRNWLELMRSKAERRVVDDQASSPRSAEPKTSSREDDDSLSWE